MGVLFEHLYEELPGQVFSVACHHREEDLLFLAKVDGQSPPARNPEIPWPQSPLNCSHLRPLPSGAGGHAPGRDGGLRRGL